MGFLREWARMGFPEFYHVLLCILCMGSGITCMYGIELCGICGLSDGKVPKTFIVTEDITKLILLLEVTINRSCVVRMKMVPVIIHYLT